MRIRIFNSGTSIFPPMRIGDLARCLIGTVTFVIAGLMAGFLTGQLTYEDVWAGFHENQLRFQRANVEFHWKYGPQLRIEDHIRYSEAIDALDLLAGLLSLEPDSHEYTRIKRWREAFEITEAEDSSATQQYFVQHATQGCRLRILQNSLAVHNVDLLDVFDSNIDDAMSVWTAIRGEPFVSRGITQKIDNPTRIIRSFYVGPFDDPNISNGLSAISPVSLTFGSHQSPFDAIGRSAFRIAPEELVDGEDRVSIREEGSIAILEIETKPRSNSVALGAHMGFRLYAEIETDKGYLPRVVKTGHVYLIENETVYDPEPPHWSDVIFFTNLPLEGVGFYSAETSYITYTWFPKVSDVDFLANRIMANPPTMSLLGLPKERLGPLLENKYVVTKAMNWDPSTNPIFTLEAPPLTTVVIDKKTGENYRIPDTPSDQEPVLSFDSDDSIDGHKTTTNRPFQYMWFGLWVLLSLIGLRLILKKSRSNQTGAA